MEHTGGCTSGPNGTGHAGCGRDHRRWVDPRRAPQPMRRTVICSAWPIHIHVDPGGDTSTDRTEHVAFESESEAGIDEVGRASLDVQDEAERSRTRQGDAIEGERTSALAHGRTTMSAV